MPNSLVLKMTSKLLLFLLISTIWACQTAPTSTSSPPAQAENARQSLSYQLPANPSFAGEAVPIQDPEVYERLDYEFASVLYRHSRTLLNYKRAARWFPQIEPILKEAGIPEDFKYIAVIESNLMNLVSPRGAKGFWQFMPETAQEFGLIVSEDIDERYHPIKATKAAVKYFKKAHNRFKDWTLAAASYNLGMGGIGSRLKAQGVDNYYDLYLNTETSRYILRAVAVKYIFENAAQYGYNIPEEARYQPLQFKEVSLKAPADLVAFAQSQGITYKALRVYNPWLRNAKIAGKRRGKNDTGEYTVLIPE